MGKPRTTGLVQNWDERQRSGGVTHATGENKYASVIRKDFRHPTPVSPRTIWRALRHGWPLPVDPLAEAGPWALYWLCSRKG